MRKKREHLHIQTREYVYFYFIRDNLCSSIYCTIGSEEKHETSAQCEKIRTEHAHIEKQKQCVFTTKLVATSNSYICYLGEGRVNVSFIMYVHSLKEEMSKEEKTTSVDPAKTMYVT